MTETIDVGLLKRLCEAHGVSGREDDVRELVREELAPLVDEISIDALGNLVGVRRGSGGPRVMIAGHLDEIGFLVKHIDDDGFLRLHPVGGFDPSRLPAQRVIVHGFAGGQHRGSIGVAGKPIHLQVAGEVKPVTIDDLFVDIGLTGEQCRAQVEIGDMVTMDRTLESSGNHLMTKTLDDRVGIFIMLEALKALDGPVPAEIIAVATVQEEVGTRGAMTVAWAYEPDIAIALDITPAGDFPGAPPEFVAVKLGAGVALKIMDVTAISDYRLNQRLRRNADAEGIPYQLEILGRGGTDAGSMQRSRGGVPVTALSVPVRYAHTANETCAAADIQAAIDLLAAFLARAHLDDESN